MYIVNDVNFIIRELTADIFWVSESEGISMLPLSLNVIDIKFRQFIFSLDPKNELWIARDEQFCVHVSNDSVTFHYINCRLKLRQKGKIDAYYEKVRRILNWS